MQKIIPHLWFDKQAVEAADFYTSIFPNSKVTSNTILSDTPSGSVDVVTFELLGLEFQAISAGPLFKFNPSLSFMITCPTKTQVDEFWKKLAPGGRELMELGDYPFSERYVWLEDIYGLSWQIMYSNSEYGLPKIAPMALFVGQVCGQAEAAIQFWTATFPESTIHRIERYGKDEEPDQAGTVKFASFALFGQEFNAMESAYDHRFAFNEAISFIVKCETQEEIDAYWNKLSAVPEAEQCGWLKDVFGVSWQIVPAAMDEMMSSGTPEQIARVTEAFLKMKKFDLATLQRAYQGNA